MKPGDRIAIVQDGETRVETVNGWSYRSGSPAIYAELTWWQRAMRRLTPARWRRPIPVVHEATAARVELHFGEFEPVGPDVMARCQKNIAAVHAMAEAMASGR